MDSGEGDADEEEGGTLFVAAVLAEVTLPSPLRSICQTIRPAKVTLGESP